MLRPLLVGLATFAACWLLHLIQWRIRRPAAYPIWLPAIFLGVPVLLHAAAWSVPGIAAAAQSAAGSVCNWWGAMLIHFLLTCCYVCGYAGLIEYSPSAEVLMVVRRRMPEGLPVGELRVDSLSEYALTGKRIDETVHARMAREQDGRLALTGPGRLVFAGCRVYRVLFGVSPDGDG